MLRANCGGGIRNDVGQEEPDVADEQAADHRFCLLAVA
jgi:hypothetical protein